ncbi:hypothetical protein K7X08_020126 [Anisodus acutangulus]|uniref:Uncharacterized protein n=1 Tax=Anisodus acutangulus TaxID=402998 RepID=A0A9Q1M5W0_9SOLA|nr:hypothetical protein K7X08_020126 [Anisodus acutangulus]
MAGKRKDKKGKTGCPTIKPKFNLQVPNFFTPAESQAFVKSVESLGFAHQGSLGPAYGEAYRDNDRVSMNDPDLAGAIWSGLNKLISDIKI